VVTEASVAAVAVADVAVAAVSGMKTVVQLVVVVATSVYYWSWACRRKKEG
jgi:hypothetical protein